MFQHHQIFLSHLSKSEKTVAEVMAALEEQENTKAFKALKEIGQDKKHFKEIPFHDVLGKLANHLIENPQVNTLKENPID